MKDIELPEPLGYMNAGHVHELQQGRLHYGYVYPKGGTGAEDAVYTADQLRAAVEADRAQRVPEGCYLSWGGFNIHGDSKSIQEVNRLMHEAGTVPDLKAMLAQSYKELAKEAPELCDPSCATYDVAAMVMSDCGHSTNNQRLLDRIAARIDKHVESLIVSTPAQPAQQPVERKPMTKKQRNELIKTVAESIDHYNIVMTHWPLVIEAVERYYGIRE